MSVPSHGGTVLTLTGEHFWSKVDDEDLIKVFVCDQECHGVRGRKQSDDNGNM